MKKLLLLPLLLILTLPFSYASEIIVDYYDAGATSTAYQSLAAVHPSATGSISGISQSFRARYNEANLTTVQIYAYQSGASNCFLVAKIEGHTGTWGSTGTTNGTVYATSDYVNVTSWAGAYALINFSFPSGYVFDASQAYTLCIYGYNGSDYTTNTIAVDESTPIYHWGNFASFASSTWTATAARDLIFYIYGDGGDLVAWNVGGTTVTITEITETTNVTANVTAEINATAEFNNTSVTANGDITAGAVTAGDVTANGAVTFGGDLSVNGTFDNATLTYVTSTAVSGDANVYFLIAFIALAVLLTFYNKVPLMNFLVGIVGISFITLSFQNTDLPFWPYSSVLLALVSLLCMISGGFKMRSN